jgi:hypothetical protein
MRLIKHVAVNRMQRPWSRGPRPRRKLAHLLEARLGGPVRVGESIEDEASCVAPHCLAFGFHQTRTAPRQPLLAKESPKASFHHASIPTLCRNMMRRGWLPDALVQTTQVNEAGNRCSPLVLVATGRQGPRVTDDNPVLLGQPEAA